MSKVILVSHACLCLTCEEPIALGAGAYWEPQVGCWHPWCPAPKNLQHYIDKREHEREWDSA